MEEGPFRMQPSPDRRGTSRPVPVQQTARQPEPVQPVAAEPRSAAPQRPVGQKKPKGLKIVLAIAALIIAGLAGWLVWSNIQGASASIAKDQYQAVFFSNGNVYFGNLENASSDYYKMTGVYYPQTQTTTTTEGEAQQQPQDQSSITLLKLGDAIHGPDDEMMIAKDQVLFFQNLRADSRVAQLIDGQSN